MTAPMTPDEARLRELADWFRDRDPGGEGSVLLSRSVAIEAGNDIALVLDALSAERERGDRAMGLLRPFERHYDLNDLDEWAHDNALEIPVYDLRAVKVFLATQKAEGA